MKRAWSLPWATKSGIPRPCWTALESAKRQAETQAHDFGPPAAAARRGDDAGERSGPHQPIGARALGFEPGGGQESLINVRQAALSALQEQQAELERLAASAYEQLGSLRAEDRDRGGQGGFVALGAGRDPGGAGIRAAASALERIETLVREMPPSSGRATLQIEACFSEILERESESQQIATQLSGARRRTQCQRSPRRPCLQFESEQVRARLLEIEETLHNAPPPTRSGPATGALELAAAVAKLQSDAGYMAETCLNELGLQRQELVSDPALQWSRESSWRFEDQVYRDMRPPWMPWPGEHDGAPRSMKETAERHAFLETQRNDLLYSIENTQATIKEIDTFSRQKCRRGLPQDQRELPDDVQQAFSAVGSGFMRSHGRAKQRGKRQLRRAASPPGQEAAKRSACSRAAKKL